MSDFAGRRGFRARDGEPVPKEPVALRDLLKSVMGELAPTRGSSRGTASKAPAGSPGKHDRLQEIESCWNGVVGGDIARMTRVIRYRGGVLTVEVSSTPLRAELDGFARDHLLRELAEAGLDGVHELRFRVASSPGAEDGNFGGAS